MDQFVVERVRATWPIKKKFHTEIFSGLAQRLREHETREELTGQLDRAAAEPKEILASQVDLEHAAGWYAKLDAWEALAA